MSSELNVCSLKDGIKKRGQETNLKQILANCLCTRPWNQPEQRAISVLLSVSEKLNSQFSKNGQKSG